MDDAPALHTIAPRGSSSAASRVKTPLNNRPVDRPAAGRGGARRRRNAGLRDNRLRIDRKPRLPLCLQDVCCPGDPGGRPPASPATRRAHRRPRLPRRPASARTAGRAPPSRSEAAPSSARPRRQAVENRWPSGGGRSHRRAIYRGCNQDRLLVVSDLPEATCPGSARSISRRVALAIELEQAVPHPRRASE